MADPLVIEPDERYLETIQRLAGNLIAHPNMHYVLVDEQRVAVTLPAPLVRVLMETARQLAQGHSVSLLHYDAVLTTQQAADLLQVSRPYLIRLLEEGKIRYHLVGSHRRVRLDDLFDYQNARDRLRQAHVHEMVRMSDSLGLYESDDFDEREP